MADLDKDGKMDLVAANRDQVSITLILTLALALTLTLTRWALGVLLFELLMGRPRMPRRARTPE